MAQIPGHLKKPQVQGTPNVRSVGILKWKGLLICSFLTPNSDSSVCGTLARISVEWFLRTNCLAEQKLSTALFDLLIIFASPPAACQDPFQKEMEISREETRPQPASHSCGVAGGGGSSRVNRHHGGSQTGRSL